MYMLIYNSLLHLYARVCTIMIDICLFKLVEYTEMYRNSTEGTAGRTAISPLPGTNNTAVSSCIHSTVM